MTDPRSKLALSCWQRSKHKANVLFFESLKVQKFENNIPGDGGNSGKEGEMMSPESIS